MATISQRTRKPVDRLTLDDFAAFPIWEYADEEGHDGQNETWVRPVNSTTVPEHSYTHVSVDFTATCGRPFAGFVTMSTLTGPPDVSQGVILHEHQSLFVSNPEAFGFAQSRQRLLDALGLTEPKMFPLSFRLRVAVAGPTKYTGGKLP